jgi:hypothetical protein
MKMIAAIDRAFCCLFQFLLLCQLVAAAPDLEQAKCSLKNASKVTISLFLQKKGDGSCQTNMDVFRETLRESANELLDFFVTFWFTNLDYSLADTSWSWRKGVEK